MLAKEHKKHNVTKITFSALIFLAESRQLEQPAPLYNYVVNTAIYARRGGQCHVTALCAQADDRPAAAGLRGQWSQGCV